MEVIDKRRKSKDEYDTLTDLQTNIRNLWHKVNAKLVIE
jgi:hypothetical protein|nr:MAG TPA: hypothetical protein [Caudoviricetes sp.]